MYLLVPFFFFNKFDELDRFMVHISTLAKWLAGCIDKQDT